MKIYDPWRHGAWIDGFIRVPSIEDADIVVLPGGADVNPALYGHSKLPTTYVDPDSDAEEMAVINEAIELNKFIIGICKGSQMLTARAGGWLIQHVNNHGGNHEIKTHDGKTLTVTSTHHQMCYPYDLPENEYQLLGWAEERSDVHLTQNGELPLGYGANLKSLDSEELFMEPEVVWYPKIRGLAIQSHPEYNSSPKETNEWLNEQIRNLI